MYTSTFVQCLGTRPYCSSQYMPTADLAIAIIRSINGDSSDEDIYKRHLALFVSKSMHMDIVVFSFSIHFLFCSDILFDTVIPVSRRHTQIFDPG